MSENLQQFVTQNADLFHHHHDDALKMLETLQTRPQVMLYLLGPLNEEALIAEFKKRHDRHNPRHANVDTNIVFVRKIREAMHAPETQASMLQLVQLMREKNDCAEAMAPTAEEEEWHRKHDDVRGHIYDMHHESIASKYHRKDHAELAAHIENHAMHQERKPPERPELVVLRVKAKEIDHAIREINKTLIPVLGGRLHRLKTQPSRHSAPGFAL